VNKVSDEFFYSLRHYGSVCGVCRCGCTHFASHGTGYEDGELEQLRAKAKQSPNSFIEHPNDFVLIAHLDDKEFVYNCACRALEHYETMFWKHKEEILKYFTARHNHQIAAIESFNNVLKDHAKSLQALEHTLSKT